MGYLPIVLGYLLVRKMIVPLECLVYNVRGLRLEIV